VSAFVFDSIYLALREIGDAGEAILKVTGERWEIIRLKMRGLCVAYERIDKEGVRSQVEFREFVDANKFWQQPYCTWCAVRDQQPVESAWLKFHVAPDLVREEFAAPHFDAQFFMRERNITTIASSWIFPRTQHSTELRSRTH
jgi:hypothetical protein